MVMKECIICGKPFDARGRAKCCSPECSKINNRETERKWREANYEKVRESNRKSERKWREANPEKARESSRKSSMKWREANTEKALESTRKWRDANSERVCEYNREWREANPEYYKEHIQNKIAELNEQFNGDLDQILKKCPTSWQVREAIMQVKYGVSYSEAMYQKIRLNPVCEVTGEKTNDLVIHHLYSFNTHPELGNDPANMVRITSEVHKAFHKEYGYGDNTPEQWMEFIESL